MHATRVLAQNSLMLRGVFGQDACTHNRQFEGSHTMTIPVGTPHEAKVDTGGCRQLTHLFRRSNSTRIAARSPIPLPISAVQSNTESGLNQSDHIGQAVGI